MINQVKKLFYISSTQLGALIVNQQDQNGKEYENKPFNNTRIIFREVDCDKEESIANEYKVEGYPTIKMVKDGEVIEYDAKPKYDTLVQFLNSTL